MGITTSTAYGRQEILWPDFAHEGGSALHGKITSAIASVSNNLTSKWSGNINLANGATHNFVHNFALGLVDLTIAIYVGNTFVQEGSSATWNLSQISPDEISITNNTGSTQDFYIYVLGFNLEKMIGDAGTTGKGLVTALAQTFAGLKTFQDGVAVDTISEKTAAAGVTIDGLQIKDSNLIGVETEQLNQQSSTPATPASGKSKFYVKNDGVAYILNSDGIETPVGSGSTIERVSHTGHGFIVGTPLYDAGTNLAKANNSDSVKAEVINMVSRVIDANTFEVITNGIPGGGLVAACFKEGVLPVDGAVCWLSDEDGKLTYTAPSTVSFVDKPIFFVRSVDATYAFGYFNNMRGSTVGGTNLYTTIPLNNGTATSLQTVNVAAGEGGFIEGVIKIDATTDYVTTFKVEFARPITGTAYTCTPQYGCDALPTGSSIDITSGGVIQLTLPSITGFSSGTARFSMQAAAVGATLPLQISGSLVNGPVLGSTSGTAPAAGYVGEEKSQVTANTAFTTEQEVCSVTLTTGTWLVNGTVRCGTSSGVNKPIGKWSIKGSTDTTLGKGQVDTASVSTETCSLQMPTRIVTVASGDADKTVKIRGSNSLSTTQDAYIVANRL